MTGWKRAWRERRDLRRGVRQPDRPAGARGRLAKPALALRGLEARGGVLLQGLRGPLRAGDRLAPLLQRVWPAAGSRGGSWRRGDFLREDLLILFKWRQVKTGEQSPVNAASVRQAVCIKIRIGFQARVHRIIGGNKAVIAGSNYPSRRS